MLEFVRLTGYPQIQLSILIVFITNNREAPTGPVFPVENDCLRILQLAGKFLPEHPTWYKIRSSKTSFWTLKWIKFNISFLFTSGHSAHLHDGQIDSAEADGGFQCGHSLGVSQTVKTGIVHLQ